LEVTGTLDSDINDSDDSTYAGTIRFTGTAALIFQGTMQTLSGPINGMDDNFGDLTVTGSTGILTLGGTANSYGTTTVEDGGTLSISADGNLGEGENTLDGGTLQLTSNTYGKGWTLEEKKDESDPPNTIQNIIETVNNVMLTGKLTGDGGFTKTGEGTLTLALADDKGANDYKGSTIVQTGTLAGDIAEYTALTVVKGAIYDGLIGDHILSALYDKNSDAFTVAKVTGSGTLTVGKGNFSGTIDVVEDNDDETHADLIKDTTDTLTLSGTINQENVTLEAGTLNIGDADREIEGTLTASGAFTISNTNDTVLGIMRKKDGSAAITADTASIGEGADENVKVGLDILNYSYDGKDQEAAYMLISTTGGITDNFTDVYAGGSGTTIITTPEPEVPISDEIFVMFRKFPFLMKDGKEVREGEVGNQLWVETGLVWN
jgi:hypothetical protein